MPSPGMVTTVCFAIRAIFLLNKNLLGESQSRGDKVLYSASDYQRLRNTSQRRECELLVAPANYSRGEVDINLFAGDNRFLFGGDFLGKLLAQTFHQFRHFHAQKTVVKSVAQISLREAGCNHQWNAFGFQRRDRLLATGASSKIEAAHDHVALLGARCQLW